MYVCMYVCMCCYEGLKHWLSCYGITDHPPTESHRRRPVHVTHTPVHTTTASHHSDVR